MLNGSVDGYRADLAMPRRGNRHPAVIGIWRLRVSAARLARSVTVAVALALALGACAANNSSPSSSSGSSGVNLPEVTQLPIPADAAKAAGTGNATCSGQSIAYAGAQTGSNAQLGINIYNGVITAVQEHNAANPKCQVNLKHFDTVGDPNQAPGIVTQVVSDASIVGVVGLPFSGESKATGGLFQNAGLVHITPSATNVGLTQNGWTTFFRGLAPDSVQGQAAAKFLTGPLKAAKVCVVQDDSDYGIGLANVVKQALGSASDATCNDKISAGNKDLSSTVTKVIAAKPDAVFYSGYYSDAATLNMQLVNKGYNNPFVGPDGVKDPKFLELAGSASSNAYFTCPCVPGELVSSFATAYEKVSGGTAPGTYSLEAYDAATILLKGIDAGNTTRSALLAYVKNYNANGLSKHFQWDSTGELTTKTVYGYKASNGKIVYVGTI
jgi:branched-chain amino acid transport system substrate-binding protein